MIILEGAADILRKSGKKFPKLQLKNDKLPSAAAFRLDMTFPNTINFNVIIFFLFLLNSERERVNLRFFSICKNFFWNSNTIQNGGGGATTSFSSVISRNVGLAPKTLGLWVLTLLPQLVWNFKAVPTASSKLLNFNQDHLSKNVVFLIRSFMITSLIEMPIDLPNFGHKTRCSI